MTSSEMCNAVCQYGKKNPEEVGLQQQRVPDDDPRLVSIYAERRLILEDVGLLTPLDPE